MRVHLASGSSEIADVGDRFEVTITGMIGNREAEVVGFDRRRDDKGFTLLLRLTNNPSWNGHVFRDCDYILIRKLSANFVARGRDLWQKRS